MKEEWIQRYADLTLDLATNLHEDGLTIAEKHWNALKDTMEHYVFESLDEEIYFFRKVKPLFTSKLQYYHLLKAGIPNPFMRLQKFKEKHNSFYVYYKGGSTSQDDKWFVRVVDLTSTHDHLVAQLLALQELVQTAVFAG